MSSQSFPYVLCLPGVKQNFVDPPMAERDPLRRMNTEAAQHFTQPPPRYSEASLVKKLEELGIETMADRRPGEIFRMK